MKLRINKFAKIESAQIEINGITIIAGENNTGKSTVGKALYCLFNSFNDLESKILRQRVDSIQRVLMDYYRSNMMIMPASIQKVDIFTKLIKNTKNKNEAFVRNTIQEMIAQINYSDRINIEEVDSDSVIDRIYKILTITDQDVQKIILRRYLMSEFRLQLNHVNDVDEIAEIAISIKNITFQVKIKDNEICEINNPINFLTQAIYIDNPFILDQVERGIGGFRQHHSRELLNKLIKENQDRKYSIMDEAIIKEKMEKITSKIKLIVQGDFERNENNHDVRYKVDGLSEPLEVVNLSTGLKTFVIIQALIENGYLVENGTLILDEPEIHLHPEWQIYLAEIIVLLQEELQLNILINTHSPYFLNAIEVFSARAKIADRCKYYLTDMREQHTVIKDVTSNTEEIYKKLARPLQELEKIQYGIE